MAITDELREYARGLFNTRETVLAIADRIDAEHTALAAKSDRQREQLAAMEDALRRRNEGELKRRWQREIDALRDERDELREAVRLSEAKASDMVKLPKDADGKVIRIGDMVEWIDGDGSHAMEVTYLQLTSDGWYVGVKNYGLCGASELLRHHKQPTVEDVLEQFAVEVERAGGVFDVADDVWTRFAAKLRLAEEVDE